MLAMVQSTEIPPMDMTELEPIYRKAQAEANKVQKSQKIREEVNDGEENDEEEENEEEEWFP